VRQARYRATGAKPAVRVVKAGEARVRQARSRKNSKKLKRCGREL
jgi:hypothetical protein